MNVLFLDFFWSVLIQTQQNFVSSIQWFSTCTHIIFELLIMPLFQNWKSIIKKYILEN